MDHTHQQPLHLLIISVDVRKIVPSDILSDSLVNGIAKVSNTKNFKVVTNPVGVKVMCASTDVIHE